jgi:hypothetical protein
MSFPSLEQILRCLYSLSNKCGLGLAGVGLNMARFIRMRLLKVGNMRCEGSSKETPLEIFYNSWSRFCADDCQGELWFHGFWNPGHFTF